MPRIELTITLPEGTSLGDAEELARFVRGRMAARGGRVSQETIPDAIREPSGLYRCPECRNPDPADWTLVEYKACSYEFHNAVLDSHGLMLTADDDYIDNPDSGRSERIECNRCGQAFAVPEKADIRHEARDEAERELTYTREEE